VRLSYLESRITENGPTLICVCTRGNNPNIVQLIDQILKICTSKNHKFRILVVVNSPAPIYFDLSPKVEVLNFSKKGYASVRNFALSNRKKDENIYFLDDDEMYVLENGADPLEMFLQASTIYPLSLLTGPVPPIDEQTLDLLVPAYRNTNPTFKTGRITNYVQGGNLFIPALVFSKENVAFDLLFDFGGEDKELSDRLSVLGIPSRWVAEAKIFELAPKLRSDPLWLLDREANYRAIFYLSGWKNFGTYWKIKFSFLMSSGLLAYWVLSKVFCNNPAINYHFEIRRSAFRKIVEIRRMWGS